MLRRPVEIADKTGRDTLRRYYRRYANIAIESHCGFIFETPTWRANKDWGAELGYSPAQLEAVNRESVELDDGDPLEFGELCRQLHRRLPELFVFGGCCGTDHRHLDAARLAIC